jgi:hypothetical protein
MKTINELLEKIEELIAENLEDMKDHRKDHGTNDFIFCSYQSAYETLFLLKEWIIEVEK